MHSRVVLRLILVLAGMGMPCAAADPGDLPHPPPSWYPNPGVLQDTSCSADQVLEAIQFVTPDVWSHLNAGDQRGGKSVIQARNWLLMYLKNPPGHREIESKAPHSHEYRPFWINDIGSRMGDITAHCSQYQVGGRGR